MRTRRAATQAKSLRPAGARTARLRAAGVLSIGARTARLRTAGVLSIGVLAAVTACGTGGGTGAGASPTPAGETPATTPSASTPPPTPSPTRDGAALPLTGRVVAIDPGHNGGNGSDPDAINKLVPAGNGARKACDTTGTQTNAGYTEHAFTWDVAKRLSKRLRQLGARTVLTRDSDEGVGPCVNQRAAIGNKAEADAAISIHADGAAAGDHGFHVIMPGQGDDITAKLAARSRRLGLSVRDAYKAGTDSPYSTYLGRNGLDTRTDLGGLNLSTVPKVFIECGNMRNSAEAKRMSSGRFRQRAANSLAVGIAKYLG